MKSTFNTTIEMKILTEFVTLCEERKLNRSEIIETFLAEWIDKNTYFTLKCKCGAVYSSKLTGCPECKMLKTKEMENEKAIEKAEETIKENEEYLKDHPSSFFAKRNIERAQKVIDDAKL